MGYGLTNRNLLTKLFPLFEKSDLCFKTSKMSWKDYNPQIQSSLSLAYFDALHKVGLKGKKN